MLPAEIARLSKAYHMSDKPDLASAGIRTRDELGLVNLYKAGLDSTYSDSVYLAVRKEYCLNSSMRQKYLYEIDLSALDKTLFAGDEDAVGHCDIASEDDWVSSIMCMGTFRYRGSIPASAVQRLSSGVGR